MKERGMGKELADATLSLTPGFSQVTQAPRRPPEPF